MTFLEGLGMGSGEPTNPVAKIQAAVAAEAIVLPKGCTGGYVFRSPDSLFAQYIPKLKATPRLPLASRVARISRHFRCCFR